MPFQFNLFDPRKSDGTPWPQSENGLSGFLPPGDISPEKSEPKTFNQYVYTDWLGHKLSLDDNTGGATPRTYPNSSYIVDQISKGVGDTKLKFNVSKESKKSLDELKLKPYSTRDHYLLIGENSLDFFKHDLQVLDGINTIKGPDFWQTQLTPETANTNLGDFKSTPTEHNDPVMFGFDIIFDDISSPLLNGSINDFLELFSPNISEIAARKPIYEEFKQQFVKFFKTRATVRLDASQAPMTSSKPSLLSTEEGSKILSLGKKSYLNYYLKKVGGLAGLVEGNTAATKKFLVDYNKDVITLGFTEDVSLSVGVLAHLYKLLYFSKPNAKTMIPENLLRFNCDIVISEVRDYNRVVKSLEAGDIQVIKDNVSRYVYSLKECQFYFNTMPHDDLVDIGAIKTFDTYDIQFDYKYSTVKLDKFMSTQTGGDFIGYDNGAIWKVGNAGSREAAGTQSALYGKSTPPFFTKGQNKFNQESVKSPLILSVAKKGLDTIIIGNEAGDQTIDALEQQSKQNRKAARDRLLGTLRGSVNKELQTAVNKRVGILNKSLNKILNSAGITGVSPPRNVYSGRQQGAGGRIFNDVRGQLIQFLGGR